MPIIQKHNRCSLCSPLLHTATLAHHNSPCTKRSFTGGFVCKLPKWTCESKNAGNMFGGTDSIWQNWGKSVFGLFYRCESKQLWFWRELKRTLGKWLWKMTNNNNRNFVPFFCFWKVIELTCIVWTIYIVNIHYEKERKEGRMEALPDLAERSPPALNLFFLGHHVIYSNKMYFWTLESKTIKPLRTEFRITLNIKVKYNSVYGLQVPVCSP